MCRHDIGTFPKSARLRKRTDFVALLNNANKITVKGFLVVWQINDRTVPRLGISASRKIGCAVIRNRIKRFTRETFRRQRLLLPAVDIHVIARRESSSMDFFSVQRELENAFRRIGTPPCLRAACSS